MFDSPDSTALWVTCLAAGVCLAAAAFWLFTTLDGLPPEDRRFRQAAPLAFRLAWPLIRFVDFHLASHLPERLAGLFARWLRMAGLDTALTASEVASAALCAACAAALAADVAFFGTSGLALGPALGLGVLGALYPIAWLRRRIQERHRAILKHLPDMLDFITLCIQAGRSIQGAVAEAVSKGPAGPLRDELQRMLGDLHAAVPWIEALRALALRVNEPSVSNMVAAVVTASTAGSSLGPILRDQADQRRQERFSRAETLAAQAPFKLLAPLVLCIMPCTFIVIGFPVVMKFIRLGF